MNGFQIYDLEDLIAIQDQDPIYQRKMRVKNAYKQRWAELHAQRCHLDRLIIQHKRFKDIIQKYKEARDVMTREMDKIKENYNMI